jgi:hypothetical protein
MTCLLDKREGESLREADAMNDGSCLRLKVAGSCRKTRSMGMTNE